MEKEKTIETPKLTIKGNIIYWARTMIQISNISYISTVPLEQLGFPKMALLILGIAILAFSRRSPGYGVILLLGAGVWIFIWYYKNEERKNEAILCIAMNSGVQFRIYVDDKEFLSEILAVLEEIIAEDIIEQQKISININDCTITGNAKVLNDLELK